MGRGLKSHPIQLNFFSKEIRKKGKSRKKAGKRQNQRLSRSNLPAEMETKFQRRPSTQFLAHGMGWPFGITYDS